MPARRAAGFWLIEMLLAIALFSVFSVIAMRLISSSLHLTNEVTRAEATHRAFDSALARLRADVWTARVIDVRGPAAATLDVGGAEGAVTWSINAEGELVRTTAPTGAYPERQSWPDAGKNGVFRAELVGLVLDLPQGRGHDNGTYRLTSQVLLSKEMR